jgi:hypothetical protein
LSGEIFVTFGASTEALEASLASAKTAVSNLTRELAALSREQAATGASADSEIGQKMLVVAAQLTQAKSAVTGLKGELSTVGAAASGAGGIAGMLAPLTAVRASLGGMVELFAAAFAVEKIKDFISSMGELGEQTERTSMILGVTTEQVGELQYVMAATGTDSGNLDQMMGRFEVSLAKAANGTGPAVAGLKALGLSAKELIGLSFPDQMDKIADAVSRFADGPAKMAALQSLGRGFVELIPLLDQGAAGFDKLRATADATNSVLDATTTSRLVEMQHGFVEVKAAIEGLAIEGFKPFIGVVTAAVAEVTQLAEAFSNSATGESLLSAALGFIANAMRGVLTITEILIGSISGLLIISDTTYTAMGDAAIGFGKVVGDVISAMAGSWKGFWNGVVAAGKAAMLDIAAAAENMSAGVAFALRGDTANAGRAFAGIIDNAEDALASIKGAFGGGTIDWSKTNADAKAATDKVAQDVAAGGAKMVASAKETAAQLAAIWSGAGPANKAPTGPQVPNLDTNFGAQAKQAAEAVEKAYDGEVQAAQQAAKRSEESLAELLKTHQITMQQWLAQTNAALDTEAMAVINADQKAEASAALTSNQKIAIANREAATLAAIALEEQKAQDKAAEQSAAAWKSAADQIAGAMNSQVDGLLKGTTTVQQAFKNMAASMIEDVIKFCVKWVAEHAAAVAANIVGLGAQTAATATATAASAAAAKPGILASITADVGEAFAGFSAFFAPTLGPAAPAAAAGLAGGVQATAVGMAALDVGGFVHSSGVAMIHAGETVVPAKVSTPYGGGPGGGTTHIWNVTATDPQSFVAQLRNNSSDLARAVRDVFNSQPSLRPSY